MGYIRITPTEYKALAAGMRVCATKRFLTHHSITHGRIVMIDKNIWDVGFVPERIIFASTNELLNLSLGKSCIVCCRDLYWIGMDLQQAMDLSLGAKALFRKVVPEGVFLAQVSKAKNDFLYVQNVLLGQEFFPNLVKGTVLPIENETLFHAYK